MNKIAILRALGMLGATITGVVMIVGGDVVNGIGVIAAAFASSSAVVKEG